MRNLDTAAPRRSLYRGTLLLLAFVLACQAVWILAAELYRPALAGFPADARAAAAAAAKRNAATKAASIGVIRGGLWAECALTYLGLFWNDDRLSANPQLDPTIERAREVTDRALRFSPHDARIWLVLASIDARFDWLNHNEAAALRLSYYTGANETELIALRLPLAVRSEALGEKDFQELVGHDIRLIVTRKPELRPALLEAYRDALPSGQRFIEETLTEIDPALVPALRSKG